MASGFPASIDNFTDPLSNSPLNSPSHSAQHADVNDAVEKIETYMGLVKVIPTSATNGTVGATGTVTVTVGAASVTINGCFSSLYNSYKIIATGGGTAAATPIAFQLSGITTSYYGGVIYFAYAGGGPSAPSAVGFNNAANWQEIGHSNVNGCNLNMEIQNPNLAKHKAYGCFTPNINTAGSMVYSNGICASTTQATGFVLSIGSTFSAGTTITVYGYRI